MPDESLDRSPNILVLFPDQHRSDWVGYRGARGVRTPVIDRLAARGTAFERTWCASPLCAPSRACLTAGRRYDAQPVRSNSDDYPLDGPSVYRALRSAGYWVAACGKTDLRMPSRSWGSSGWHEREDGSSALDELGFSAGVDSAGKYLAIVASLEGTPEPYTTFLEARGLLQTHLDDYAHRPFPAPTSRDPRSYLNTDPTPLPDDAYCDNWIGRGALALIDSAPDDRPWFLQVNFTGPHDPMDITASMSERWQDRELPPPIANDTLTPAKHQQIRRNYAAMIENIDSRCGEILDRLEATGVLANTIVVYSSDHGEMLGDLGHWGKVVPYEPSVSVPLVIAGPGVVAGRRVASPVAHVDLTATILDLAGATPEDELDGISLVPLLQGAPHSQERALMFCGIGSWRAVSDGRYKYVRGYVPGASVAETMMGSYRPADDLPELLFDLVEDPHELHDLVADSPEELGILRQAMRAAGL